MSAVRPSFGQSRGTTSNNKAAAVNNDGAPAAESAPSPDESAAAAANDENNSEQQQQQQQSPPPVTEQDGPYTYVRGIRLTRDPTTKSFGLQLQSLHAESRGTSVGCGVKKVMTYVSTPPGLIHEGDVLVSVNGKDASKWTYEKTVQEIQSMKGNTLLISLRRENTPPKGTKRKRKRKRSGSGSGSSGANNNGANNSNAQNEATAAAAATPAAASNPASAAVAAPAAASKPAAKPAHDTTNSTECDATPTAVHPPLATNQDEEQGKAKQPKGEEAKKPKEVGTKPNEEESKAKEKDNKAKPKGKDDEAKPKKKSRKKKKKKDEEEKKEEKGKKKRKMSADEDNSKNLPAAKPAPPLPFTSAPPETIVETKFLKAIQAQASNTMKPLPPEDDGSPRLGFVFITRPKKEGTVMAELIMNDMKIGAIRAEFIRKDSNFFEECERVGGNLEMVASAMFEEGGKLNCEELESLEADWQTENSDEAGHTCTKENYFLYVHQIEIKETFDSEEKKSDILSSLLQLFLADKRMKKWSIAAYRADVSHQPFVEPTGDLLGYSDNQEDFFENSWVETEKEKRKWIGIDSRPFLRVGFQELSKETTDEIGVLYVTKELLLPADSILSHYSADQIKLRCDEPPDVEHLRKEKLQSELQMIILEEDSQLELENHKYNFQTPFQRSSLSQYDDSAFVQRVVPKIDELIAMGADVKESSALHAAAYQHFVGLFVPLIDRGATLNSRDVNSMSPLMILASNVGKRTENDCIRSQLAISTLVAMGADKNLRDRAGRTALGHYYRTMKDLNSLETSQLGVPETPIDTTLERLLMPEGGPSEADIRAKNGA